jgi:hypothetical protein
MSREPLPSASTDEESMSEKLADQWRMTCPDGHHKLNDMEGPTVYCEGCGHAYRYDDLIDKKARGETPLGPATGRLE